MAENKIKQLTRWFFISLICLSIAGGCIPVAQLYPSERPGIVEPQDGLSELRKISFGISVEGRALDCFILGEGKEVVFIMAAIHGNEPAGPPLVRELVGYLDGNPRYLSGKTVVLMPVANPDGLLANKRLNANGVDLNRNFATGNWVENEAGGPTPRSEPETRVIEQLIRQYKPARIVSIHQPTDMDVGGLAREAPRGCIDYDGPGKALAERMAQYCELEVNKLGAQRGSLGSYAGQELGIACITMELATDAHMLDKEQLWQRYGKALLTALIYPDKLQ